MKVFVISRGMPNDAYPLNGIFEFDQAKALAKVGNDVTMLVIDFRSRSYKRKYGCFLYDKDGVNIVELSLPLGVYRRALPVLKFLMVRLYKKAVKSFGTPDIIHAHFYSIAAIASVLKKKFNIPFVITEHSSKLNKNIFEISKLDKKLVKKSYSCANKVIAVSDDFTKTLKRNFNVDAIMIPDIVDVSNFQYVKREHKNTFTFVSVGNLIYRKGFDLLIEAFANTFKNDSSVFLNIVGEGEERKNLETIINQYGMNDNITLCGHVNRDKIHEIYNDADAFVLVSRNETFGVVYIEAMATGLPVIATACGGPSAFVNDKNGLLIPVDDKNELINALYNMHNTISNFNTLEISRLCVEKFSPENIGKSLTNLFQEVIR